MTATSPAEALRIEGLRKSFGPLQVLRGIDLVVAQHEVVCLIGASGSGKSTLLRCVNLLEPIDAGRVVVNGEEITARGVDVDRIRRRIGIVFQAFNLFPHMTVLGNVTLAPRKVLGRPAAEATEAADALLARFGLADSGPNTPTDCRAASSSASRSSGRWPWSRTCCSSTRSPARSTRSSWPTSSTSSGTSRPAG